ncbi:hypothetical protein C8J56DRAFT_952786, partial [Mycena floridula]
IPLRVPLVGLVCWVTSSFQYTIIKEPNGEMSRDDFPILTRLNNGTIPTHSLHLCRCFLLRFSTINHIVSPA